MRCKAGYRSLVPSSRWNSATSIPNSKSQRMPTSWWRTTEKTGTIASSLGTKMPLNPRISTSIPTAMIWPTSTPTTRWWVSKTAETSRRYLTAPTTSWWLGTSAQGTRQRVASRDSGLLSKCQCSQPASKSLPFMFTIRPSYMTPKIHGQKRIAIALTTRRTPKRKKILSPLLIRNA